MTFAPFSSMMAPIFTNIPVSLIDAGAVKTFDI